MTDHPYPEIDIRLLTGEHETEDFTCGDESLDSWLQERALKNQTLDATRTFVATIAGERSVIAYYGLSMSEIIRTEAPKAAQRNMPESIPVVLLGRLAIHQDWQGKGLGRYLVRHLIKTALVASQAVAARMIITKPIDEAARHFYLAVGFEPLRGRPDVLAIDLKKVAALLG
ncbi:MAG: GNAT family N-acetyltransferase [Thiolinea sp.]